MPTTSNRFAIPTGLRVPLIAFISSRIVVWIAMYIPTLTGFSLFSNPEARFSTIDLLNEWVRWDAGWYLRIVENGYWFSVTEESSVAFFPVYPMLIRALTPLVNDPILAGLLISHVCFFLSLIVLYQLVIQVLGIKHTDTAKRAVYFMAWFPASFFFSSVFTESLFLLLTLLTAYYAYQQKWGIAALCGAVAAGARVTGILMLALIGIEWLQHAGWSLRSLIQPHRWKPILAKFRQDWRIIMLWMLVPLGLLIYMVFLYLNFGDPIAFKSAQATWGWETTNPINTVFTEIQFMLSGEAQLHRLPYFSVFDIVALLAVLVMVPAIARLRESWAVYCALSVLIPASVFIQSMMRYVAVLFPVFIVLAMNKMNPRCQRVYNVVSVILLIVFSLLHVNWIFVG